MRKLGQALAAVLLGAVVLGLPVTPAQATAYRYWTYWHAAPGSSEWTFAGSGPTYRPSDGAVEGWRFAVSQGTTSAPKPRTDPETAYRTACAGVTAPSGQKVVALVLDDGTSADAPPGEKPPAGVRATCVQVASNATGLDVLRAAGVAVREQDGLVCGLNGYPKTECAVAVLPSPTASPTPPVSPTPTVSHRPTAQPSSSHPTSHPTSRPQSSDATPTVTPTPSPQRSSAKPATHPSSTSPTTPVASASEAAVSPASPVTSSDSSTAAVADATPSLVVGGVASTSSHGRPWALVGGLGLLAAIGAGAGLRARRRP